MIHISAMYNNGEFFEKLLQILSEGYVKKLSGKSLYSLKEEDIKKILPEMTRKMLKKISQANNRGWNAFELPPKIPQDPNYDLLKKNIGVYADF